MHISELVRTLLKNRGIETSEHIEAFLSPDYTAHAHDPFLMPDMDAAVARVLEAIEQNERIAVYADYDCDGIPGAALVSDFFNKIGYENFEVYLPHEIEKAMDSITTR
jgi:single-stranded-DNA-specific exonuclease